MNISPLWIAVAVACLLGLLLVRRIVAARSTPPLARSRLSLDDGPDSIETTGRLFRLGRLSLSDSPARDKQ